ncbi:MAG: zinc ribbon domain-containing protein [Dehalococcoidia bacterium]|nr:zinc ribbon domain-containing protein [Dehalococcoidia bacterium]
MPIYEYVCPDCKTKFEQMRPMSQSDASADCIKCGVSSPRTLSRFACLAKDDTGYTAPLGGGGCSGCTSGSCGSCGAG